LKTLRLAVVVLTVLMGGCGSSSSKVLLTGLEGYHPQFAHLMGWFDRSVLVLVPVPAEAAAGLRIRDEVVLCFSRAGEKLSFSSVARSRPAVGCEVYAKGSVEAYGGDGLLGQPADPLMIAPDFPVQGPWFNRDAQRKDEGVIKEISAWVELSDDGRVTRGVVASVHHRQGHPIAPK
jgi:hypothetical protein